MAKPKRKRRPNKGAAHPVKTFASNVFAEIISGTLSGLLINLILHLLNR
jgi:hypothetical protein